MKKLTLKAETIGLLAYPALQRAAGGLQTFPVSACTDTAACPTTTGPYSATDGETDASCNVWCILF